MPLGSLNRRIQSALGREMNWLKRHGSFREREQHGLVDRANYCYGMLRAADQARYLGLEEVTALEFGVASGNGLANMCELAVLIEKETGVHFNILGFDSGGGLPTVAGFKDHPELWCPGDFAMEDRDALLERIDGKAEIVFGDINETVDVLAHRLSPANPLGFASIDVDVYSGCVGALRSLTFAAENYLPGVSLYFDDAMFFYANDWAGELLAINEFNEVNELRKIGPDRSLPGRRPVRDLPWFKAMYVAHILDHKVRNEGFDREALTIGRHHEFMLEHVLY